MTREKPTIWGCEHRYPILVEGAEGHRCARCLGCGTSGPPRSGAKQAMLALRAETRTVEGQEPNLPAHYSTDAREGRFSEV